jgi:hypothetical protein
VPNFCAQNQPVKDLRLVAAGEEGELFGVAVSRIGFSQLGGGLQRLVPLISSNSPEPRGPTRFSGARRREGALCCMIPAEPLAQSTPRFTGWSRLPSI